MMERGKLPLDAARDLLGRAEAADPLSDLRNFVLEVFRVTVEDPQVRRVFEIASLKMEFVDELDAVRMRRREHLDDWMQRAEGGIRLAIERGEVRPNVSPQAEALGMWAVVDGLIRAWLFDPTSFDLMAVGAEITETHLAGLRAR
jgi:TetR/AcrR family acrAB operon transcriptional repressor